MIIQHRYVRRTPFVHSIHHSRNFLSRDECFIIRHVYQRLRSRFSRSRADAGRMLDCLRSIRGTETDRKGRSHPPGFMASTLFPPFLLRLREQEQITVRVHHGKRLHDVIKARLRMWGYIGTFCPLPFVAAIFTVFLSSNDQPRIVLRAMFTNTKANIIMTWSFPLLARVR
jgi:hypothetical protein